MHPATDTTPDPDTTLAELLDAAHAIAHDHTSTPPAAALATLTLTLHTHLAGGGTTPAAWT